MNSKPGNISGDELQNRQALHQKMTLIKNNMHGQAMDISQLFWNIKNY